MAGSNAYAQFYYEVTGGPGNELVLPSPGTKTIYPPFTTYNAAVTATQFERDDELRGIGEEIAFLPDQINWTATLTVPAYPDSLGFFLKAVCDTVTTTAGDGSITDPDSNTIPSGAYRHVFAGPGGSGAVPVTMGMKVVEKDQPDGVVAWEGRGVAATSVAFAINGAKVELQISLEGTSYIRIADPSLSPSYESLANVHPFRESQITIPTWLTSTGKDESGGFDFTITKPVQTHRTMSIASLYPDYIDKGDGLITVTGNVEKRYLNSTDWDAYINSTGFATKVKFANESIVTGSTHYGMWLQTANTQYKTGDPTDITNSRNLGAKYAWNATTADGSAGSWSITLVNATAAYN